MPLKQKKIRKHKGINQNTGRLKKGFKYSGKTLKSGLKKIIQTKITCKTQLSIKIKKNIHEKIYKNNKQAIAVAYSQVKKARPGCKKILKIKGGNYRQSFNYCKSCN